jgi:hypothetical protein
VSKLIIALVAGTTALFASSAIAAPLNPSATGVGNGVEKVRMVCDQSGRCWRERGERRMIRRESYGYDRRRHRDYDRGPSVGIHAPGVSVGIGDGRRW